MLLCFKFTRHCLLCFSYNITYYCSADQIGHADVGLQEENPDDDRGHGFFGVNRLSRMARWAQPITYMDIYECDSFTVNCTISSEKEFVFKIVMDDHHARMISYNWCPKL